MTVITIFGYIYYLRNRVDLRIQYEKRKRNFYQELIYIIVSTLMNHFSISMRLFQKALIAFSQSVMKAQETSPEPYEWRSRLYLKLNLETEAAEDLSKAQSLSERLIRKKGDLPKQPFIDMRFIFGMILVLFTSLFVVIAVKKADSIHLPYIVAVLCAIAIGFTEPRKG